MNSYNNPKVSVIVPVYQAEKKIDRCVKSLLSQTYHNIEVILIDDGSSDNSPRMCNRWATIDERVISITMPYNMGVSAARNKGLDLMKGDYFCFLDSDDYIKREMIQDAVNRMQQNASDICFFGFEREINTQIYEMGSVDEISIISKNNFLNCYFWSYFDKRIIHNIGTKLYKSKVAIDNLIRFNETIGIKEDVSFTLEFIKHCETICSIDKAYYIYTYNSTSIMNSYVKDYEKGLAYYANVLSEMGLEDQEKIHYTLMRDSFGYFVTEILFGSISVKHIYELVGEICKNYGWKNVEDRPSLGGKVGRDEVLYFLFLKNRFKICLVVLGIWERIKYKVKKHR